MEDEKIIIKAEKLLNQWKYGSLTLGSLGYKFQPYKFWNLAYLYLHGVDAKNPDLMDEKNPHHFIPDFIAPVTKINEQTRIDLNEIGFVADGHSELAKYVVKAANRKALTSDNSWTEVQEMVTDDANWYGDGIKKIYNNSSGVQKHKHIDPWGLVWDLNNFKKSAKMEILNKTLKEVTENKRYKAKAKKALSNEYDNKLETQIQLFQYIDDNKMYIISLDKKIVLMNAKRPKGLFYVKYSHEYRRGFEDAPGRGIFEKIMNVIIQNKVARERYNEVEAIASKLLYAKVVDGKNDKIQNKQVQNLKNGLVIPVSSADNVPQPVGTGGQAQLSELLSKISQTRELYDNMLSTPDVLDGNAKTLGANPSGIAIQNLHEYASSVHKDVKKRYARVAEWEYKTYIMPYILRVFNSEDNIKKFLDPIEWNVVKRNIINYELAITQAELLGQGIAPEQVNSMLADEEVKLRREFKTRNIISKNILEALREDVKGIEIAISGEKVSRQVKNEFYQQLENAFLSNPNLFVNPAYISILKKKGKNMGMDELEITELINDLQ